MQDKIMTRMGDGARVEFSAEQVKEEILAGLGFRPRLRLVDQSPTGRRVEPTARREG
jgi:hypothetical protein